MCWSCDSNGPLVQDGWRDGYSRAGTTHFQAASGVTGINAVALAAQSASGTIGGDDPVPDDSNTSYELTVGAAPTVGTLETVGDNDYFKVRLVAGQVYEFGMNAKYGGPNGVPLLDSLFEIRDSAGTLLTAVDSGGKTTHNAVNSGYDALTTFTAPYSGLYFVNAKSFDEGVNDGAGHYVGDYELFVTQAAGGTVPNRPPSTSIFATTKDTVANDLTTTSTIGTNGRPVISTIDAPGDFDFYKVEMVAGNVYRINQSFAVGGPSGVPLADSHFEIYDPTGRLVATGTSGGSMPGGLVTTTVNAQLDYVATETGTFYINARGGNYINGDPFAGEVVGDYKLTVEGWKPFYKPDAPLYALDWGTQVDRTSRNPDGAEGPRVTGNPYSGVGHNEEGIQGKNVIYYYFAKQGEVYTSQDPANDVLTNMVSSGFRDWEMKAFEMAMDKYEQVADLVYVEVFDKAKADFIFITYDGTPQVGILGRMSPPGTTNEGQAEFNRNGPGWTEAQLKPGGFSFITLIHELGHGHGLAHPHDKGGRSGIMQGVVAEGTAFDYTTGAYDLNQGVFTMMSYEDGWQTSPYGNASTTAGYGYLSGLMAFDIAAIQDKYGVNEDWATGDDVYVMKDVNASGTMYESIWDAGGIDSIVYGGNRDATIDLRPATLKYEYGGGGWVSYAHGIFGGFTIANGVTIENASSGGGKDKLIGNDVANRLHAGAGNDVLDGGGGNDMLIGGTGKDTLTGGAGADTFVYESILDSPVGALLRDVILDFEKGDRIDLTAAGGRGFIGSQMFSGAAGQVRAVTLTDQTIIELDSNGDRIGDLQIELAGVHQLDRLDFVGLNGVATSGADELFGTSGADTINGLGGNDSIYGAGGNDTLNGDGGNDVLVGGLGRDLLTGGLGADRFRIESIEESGAGSRDRILDFEQGLDKIDLSALGISWTFIGQAAFGGEDGPQLRYSRSLTSVFIEGDIDGDKIADLQIEISRPLDIAPTDFIF
jgi:Ca2+-binding RTX toxin-like protein